MIAGSVQSITDAIAKLPSKRISARRLAVSAAFHTPMLAESAKESRATPGRDAIFAAEATVFSNTTADVYPSDADEMRQLLTRHLIEPVRFYHQVSKIYEHGARVFIEAGPGSVLDQFDVPHPRRQTLHFHRCRSQRTARFAGLGDDAGVLWVLGLPVRLGRWFQYRRLPNYGLSEFVNREKAKHTRRPTDWVVNSCRAVPVSAVEQRRPPAVAKTVQKAIVSQAPPSNGSESKRDIGGNGTEKHGPPNRVARTAPVMVPTVAPKTIKPLPTTSIPTTANSQLLTSKKRSVPSRIGKMAMITTTNAISNDEFDDSAMQRHRAF